MRADEVLGEAGLSLSPAILAGADIVVQWTGPANRGDYFAIVPAGAPAAQMGKYADAERGSPSRIVLPVEKGPAEIRYISGQGRIILGRRAIESK